MRKSKLIVFLLTLVLVLGNMGFVFADGNSKISKDEAKSTAVKLMKDLFGIAVDEKKSDIRIEFREDYEKNNEYLWDISHNIQDGEKDIDIDVQVDANTGKVIGFSKHEYRYDEKMNAISITEDEAKKIAEKFISTINPNEFKEAKFVPDNYTDFYGGGYYPSNYSFRYIRTINGIEFGRNYIQIEVDIETGDITGYRFRWDEKLNVPSSDDVISKEEANEIYKKEIKMKLSYMPYRDELSMNEKPDGIKVVYTAEYPPSEMIDAKKGIMINYSGKTADEIKTKDLNEKEKESFTSKYKNASKLNKEIEKNEASTIINEIIKDVFGSDFEIESIRYIEDEDYWRSNGKKAWSAEIIKKEDRNYRGGGEISIDALTKEIISINKYFYNYNDEKKDPRISFDEAYYKAIDRIAKYFPSKVKEIDTKQVDYGYNYDNNYYLNFPRTVDGIAYSQNGIDINIDNQTGDLIGIRAYWDDIDNLPDISKVIDKEKAHDIFFSVSEPKLIYSNIDKSEKSSKPNMETILVYNLENEKYPIINIDAVSGLFLNYNGEVVQDKDNEFSETIKGHWAEKTLSMLASRGIINTKDFDLNKEITKIQAIKMVVNVKGYEPYLLKEAKEINFKDITKNSEDYKYLKLAVKYKLIEDSQDNFNPNDKIARQDMAKLLVKFINYDKLAKASDIYSLNFKDAKEIKPENIGYMAVCKGLGVFEGSNGMIRPNDNATMVEMAVSVYKAMANMK